MKCHALNRKRLLAPRLHRLWCRDCRQARELDSMLGYGLAQLREEPISTAGLSATLALLDIPAGGKHVRRAARGMGRRWLGRKALGLAGFAVVAGVWWQYMNYLPPLHAPQPTYPSPNAFTYYKEAGNKLVDDKQISKALSPPLKIGVRLDEEGVAHYPPNPASQEIVYTPEDRKMLLAENQETLRIFRQGMPYPYAEPYVRSIDTLFPHYSKFRGIARLLALEAQVHEEAGDWNSAVQSELDAIQLGTDIPRQAPLIAKLVGIACEAIGRNRLWYDMEHLNVAETRQAIARLETLQARHIPFAQTLEEEKWGSLVGIEELMRKPNWRLELFKLVETTEGESHPTGPDLRGLITLGWSNRTVIRNLSRFHDEQIRRSRLPYPVLMKLPEAEEPQDVISRIMCPVFAQAGFKDLSGSRTQNALLLTTLALHAYKLEHGQYPVTLQQLAPVYLKRLPDDPFAVNGPLQYVYNAKNRNASPVPALPQQEISPDETVAKKGDTWKAQKSGSPVLSGQLPYVLYSIGPDGKDDGGIEVDRALRPGRCPATGRLKGTSRYLVNATDEGDIVAGINTH